MTKPVILASGSEIRAEILRGAGVDFTIIRPDVDEDAIKRDCAARGLTLRETAARLADEKCLAVARETPEIVIGSDQIMAFKGAAFDKPKDMGEARARLLAMRGAAHSLINAVSVAQAGEIVWRRLEEPQLYLRNFSEAELDRYLQEAGPEILKSVGAYQIEKLGSRLFDRIEGDHYAVLGLALYPLLASLRALGAIAY